MGLDYSQVFTALKGGKGSFIYNILSKWYIAIAIPAIYVTYHFFKGLEKAGILASFTTNLKRITDSIEHISIECPQKLGVFKEFLNCLGF